MVVVVEVMKDVTIDSDALAPTSRVGDGVRIPTIKFMARHKTHPIIIDSNGRPTVWHFLKMRYILSQIVQYVLEVLRWLTPQ